MQIKSIQELNKIGKGLFIVCIILMIVTLIGAVRCFFFSALALQLDTTAVSRIKDQTKLEVELTMLNSGVEYVMDDYLNSVREEDAALQIEMPLQHLEYSEKDGEKLAVLRFDIGDDPELQAVTAITDASMELREQMHQYYFCEAVGCVYWLFALLFAALLAHQLKRCETPFTTQLTRRLRDLLFVLVPACAIRLYPGGVSFTINAALIFVILGMSILLIVFEYGISIQQEVDETL